MAGSTEEWAIGDGRPVDEMTYTEASAELDEIVSYFEGREVDVDQLVGRLVRATAIIEELDKRLRRTQMQVDQLVPRLTAVLEEAADADDRMVGQCLEGESDVAGSAAPGRPEEPGGPGGSGVEPPGLF
jgi:exonuclease VII small subunit